MLYKTTGIVFQTVKYTDNSFIAKIYTELFGLQSFLVNSPRTKKSTTKINLFQPMNLVELVMYHKEKKQLQRLKEVKLEESFASIPFDASKRSIVFFLNEVLCKCIREEESRPELFAFVRNSLLELDAAQSKFANLHLVFLVRLAAHLGFMPTANFSEQSPLFNLQDGIFTNTPTENCLSKTASQKFYSILTDSNATVYSSVRKEILKGLLLYFKIHIQGFGEVKSRQVLEEISA